MRVGKGYGLEDSARPDIELQQNTAIFKTQKRMKSIARLSIQAYIEKKMLACTNRNVCGVLMTEGNSVIESCVEKALLVSGNL